MLMVIVQELTHVELRVKINRTVVTLLKSRVNSLGETLEVLRLQSLYVGFHTVLRYMTLH